MDILHLGPKEIEKMDQFDRIRALHYSIITYKLRMMSMNPKQNGDKQIVNFNQEPGWDHDPNFISEVPK
ncbi:MAG: hypothetical protein ACTSX4_11965 [Candidatus Helarchaeota archaeon]